jgi:hypothetical protein
MSGHVDIAARCITQLVLVGPDGSSLGRSFWADPVFHLVRDCNQTEQSYAITPIGACGDAALEDATGGCNSLHPVCSARKKSFVSRRLLNELRTRVNPLTGITPKGRFTARQTIVQFLYGYRHSPFASGPQHVF